MYAIYGFGLIREMEIFQEAGFHPLEVLQAVTSKAAALLGVEEETGTVEVGKRADLLVHGENPLDDFKLLYGSGTMRLNDATSKVDWRHCLETTIKDGLVFDTEELLADVREMVLSSHAT
jgi:imidazolonepropionase